MKPQEKPYYIRMWAARAVKATRAMNTARELLQQAVRERDLALQMLSESPEVIRQLTW